MDAIQKLSDELSKWHELQASLPADAIGMRAEAANVARIVGNALVEALLWAER